MTIDSRAKGARVEREIAKMLEAELGIKFTRNLEQVRSEGQSDLIPDDPDFPFSIEVKARKDGGFQAAWWKQAYSAALACGKHPAVIWKINNKPITCRVQLRAITECLSRGKWSAEDHHTADISLEGLCYLAREGMA